MISHYGLKSFYKFIPFWDSWPEKFKKKYKKNE